MLEVRCADLGIHCRGTLRGRSEEELVEEVAQHAGKAHGVQLNRTLIDYAISQSRGGPEPREERG